MNLLKYREYIFYSTKAQLVSETIRNHLGLLWWIIEPILQMSIFYFVFVILLQNRTADFTTFLLIGITTFTWFASSVAKGGGSIFKAGALMKQVHFPKAIFPTVVVLVRVFRFMVVFSILLIFMAFRGYSNITWLASIAVILTQLTFIYAVTLTVAAFIPFVPDLRSIMPSILSAMFFCSGVFFQIEPSNSAYKYFMLNPMARLIDQHRQVLLHGQWPQWHSLATIVVGSLLWIVGVLSFIRKMDHHYPKIAA